MAQKKKSLVFLRRIRLLSKLSKTFFLGPAKTRQNLPVFRISWADHVAQLRKGEFKRRYRMSKEKFDYLLEQCAQVDPFFKPLTTEQCRLTKCATGSGGIEPEHKLAVALRWLAGGSFLDIRLCHGIGKKTVYMCLWRAVDAINSVGPLKLEFPWGDNEKLAEMELGFAKLTKGYFRGCVFAADGFCIRIRAPRGVPNVADYYHRKKFYAIVVQAAVDSTGKFVAASFNAVGSTHDSLAMKMSLFWQRLMSGELAKPRGLCGLECYFGVGDDAYENCEFFLTPWPGRNLESAKDVFNYFQSRARIVVECSFGRLTTRWGCLWRTMLVPHTKVPALVLALMKLHNLCDEDKVIRIARADMQRFMEAHEAPAIFTNDRPLEGKELHQHRARRRVETHKVAQNQTRVAVTEHLRAVGATRPAHSRYRARTKQQARKVYGDPPPQRSTPESKVRDEDVLTTPPAAPSVQQRAAPPPPVKRRRPKNWGWSLKGSKAERRAARRRTANQRCGHADDPVHVPDEPACAHAAKQSDEPARAAKQPDEPVKRPRHTVRSIWQLMQAEQGLANLISAARAPQQRVRAKYHWDGGSTVLHYPTMCRPRLAWDEERLMAESLVDAHPDIPARFPAAGEVHTTDGAMNYQLRRADILRHILIDVTTAYNIAMGGRRHIPRAPPRPVFYSSGSGSEDARESSEEY